MYLVTGGAGFIGSNLVAALARRGDRVLVSDTLDDAKHKNLAKRGPWVLCLSPDQLPGAIESYGGTIEGVFHLGAISSTTEMDVAKLSRTNVELSQQLWQWCVEQQIPYIYASSAAVYGDGSQGFEDNPSPNALAKLQPLNPYGRSKLAFDRWVMEQVTTGKATPPIWAGLRFFNVYGPNEDHKGGQASVVFHLYKQINETGQARLFQSHKQGIADGEQKRDFVWVEDCVEVMLWLASHGRAKSSIYNVGAGRTRSFNELARAVFAAMKMPEKITYTPTPEPLRAHYQYFTEAPMTRLIEAGYPGQLTPLEEGVAIYVNDYLAKDDPIR